MTPTDFVEKFDLSYGDFQSPIIWSSGIGFTILKDRGNGYTSMYKIGIDENTSNIDLKKLWVTATYGKRSDIGISIGEKRKTSDPIDIESFDEFFCNIQTEKFFRKDQEINPKDILIKLERAHLKPSKRIKGFPLRFKIFFWRKLLPTLLKSFDWFFAFILYLLTGEKTPKESLLGRYLSMRRDERSHSPINRNINLPKPNVSIPEVPTVDFFGYKATKWSVVFYSLLQLSFFILNRYLFRIHNQVLEDIFKNSFLIVCYVILSFAICETLIPNLLKQIIEKIPTIYSRIVFMRLRISI